MNVAQWSKIRINKTTTRYLNINPEKLLHEQRMANGIFFVGNSGGPKKNKILEANQLQIDFEMILCDCHLVK